MLGYQFDPARTGEWAGKLEEARSASSWLLARHLEACLKATKRRTPEKPEGVLQIHPAAKLLTGDPKLTATKAADVIKRLLGPLEDALEGDLADAYEIAVRLRPKSSTITERKAQPSS